MADYDLAIIGGGLTGTSIARDAAGRGLRVVLFEQGDLASGASSASSRLVTGDLGNLERRALASVRIAARERDLQMRLAPHLVRSARFVIPLHPEGRPPWLLWLGLSVYGRLASERPEPAANLDLTHHEAGVSLQRPFGSAFEFSDALADDSRLVVINAVDAAARGATIRTGARCVRADREAEWRIMVIDRGRREVVTARALVSAVGAWTAQLAQTVLRMSLPAPDLYRDSQVLLPRLFDHQRAYVLQHRDGRLIFATPHAGGLTLVGTAGGPFRGDLAAIAPAAADVADLCTAVNRFFREPVAPADVRHVICGVRARPHAARYRGTPRSGVIRLERNFREAPLVTTYGGDLTSYRLRAEKVLHLLAPFFVMADDWTADTSLPGGDFAADAFDEQVVLLRERCPFLQADDAHRLFAAYGTRAAALLGDAASLDDLGPHFGAGLTGREVRHLMQAEWARTAEDVLWRRSKLGLSISPEGQQALQRFMASAA
jgi:glycerol-3-phosphate dehydrogenase